MASGHFEGIVALSVLAGFSFYQSIKIHRRLRKIEDTPRSKSATAAQGLSELQGFAWPHLSTIKTSRQKEAVFYRFKLQREETRGSGKNRRTEWVTVAQNSLTAPFFLVDATGLTQLDPQNAEINPSITETRSWNSLNQMEQDYVCNTLVCTEVSSFPPSKAFWGLFSSRYRIQEEAILQGSPVFASGTFHTSESHEKTHQSRGLTQFHKMVFNAESRSPKDVRHLLDKNKDGQISEKEALQGYVFAAELALKRATMDLAQPEMDFELHGSMIHSPEHQLFIAGAHEEHLLKRMRYQPALYLIASAACASIAVFLAFPNLRFELNMFNNKITQSSELSLATDPEKLHQECVSQNLASCMQLIHSSQDLNLSEEHRIYYKRQACRLGDSKSCP